MKILSYDPFIRFVYQSRTGNVIHEKSSEFIHLYKWKDESRHVIGGCMLAYEAALPGAYYRAEAREIAKQLVEAVSGAAYDHNGTISLVVPNHQAWRANKIMRCAAQRARGPKNAYDPDGWEAADNDAAMVLAGAAFYGPTLRAVKKWDGPATLGSYKPPKYKDWIPDFMATEGSGAAIDRYFYKGNWVPLDSPDYIRQIFGGRPYFDPGGCAWFQPKPEPEPEL